MVEQHRESPSGAWQWNPQDEPRLTWRDAPMPEAGPDEVVVRNRAAGLNPVDWKFIEWGPEIWSPGQIPGVDGAGDVVRVGANVNSDWLGQRVAYHQWLGRAGSFASHTVVPLRALMRVPPGMTYAQAAALPCPALTAWQALHKVPADAGLSVLITGAGGAVGAVLVQLAIARGWEVSAMCNQRHWDRLERLGVQAFIAPNAAQSLTRAQRFDAVFDTISGDHANSLAGCVAANGHLVCVQDRVTAPPLPPFTTSISLHEVALNSMHVEGTDVQWRRLSAAGERMMDEMLRGDLEPLPVQTGLLTELPTLLDALREHKGAGRPVALCG
ncbi:NADPH2:quinone reductase [Paraburkholderia sp. GAS199]|uniref:zinc-binding dehydrogenase n=1 Tax=Paraburkholderia sp. GAS199 TaxID=3035126 RepID=UPI003D194217